jgi:hypothetical protein
MPLNPQLLASYHQTTYWVETPAQCFALRIDRKHPEFDAFLTTFGDEWIFVTACNPRSLLVPPCENRQRMVELEALLTDVPHWPGLGVASTGDWYPEASICAVLSWSEGLRVAATFDQHALIAGRRGEPAHLLSNER